MQSTMLPFDAPETNIPMVDAIVPFAANYDVLVIDLWGVLHDGQAPYPQAIATLQALKNNGKKIVLVSNAPRRAFKAMATLKNLGFERNMYDAIMTSGEATFLHTASLAPTTGKAYYYIGPDKDLDLLDSTPFYRVDDPQSADFAVVTGFDQFGDTIDSKLPQVKLALDAKLPLICANPDRKVVRQTGEEMLCAGLLAEWYEAQGGDVTWFGKPYKAVYDRALQLLNAQDIDPKRILAIGDALHTDIKGANNIGADSVLIMGGIMANDLNLQGEQFDAALLQQQCDAHNATPTAVMSAFK